MERTAEAVATGEPLMISQLSRQTRQARGRDSLEWCVRRRYAGRNIEHRRLS